MKFLLLDVEATGLHNNSDIIQIAQFVLDSNLKVIEHHNDYLLTNKAIPQEVQTLTGLNRNILKFKSKGKFFEDIVADYKHLWYDPEIVLVAHNVEYDARMLTSNLNMHGYPPPNFMGTFCTMKTYRDIVNIKTNTKIKDPKLEELLEFCLKREGLTKKQFRDKFKYFYPDASDSAHDAFYDTFCLMFCFVKLYHPSQLNKLVRV